jgi:hypothetical protein
VWDWQVGENWLEVDGSKILIKLLGGSFKFIINQLIFNKKWMNL